MAGKTDSIVLQLDTTATFPKDSQTEVKSSDGLGMETGQTEQLDTLLSQFAKVLNKNSDAKETDAFATSKQDNRSPSPFDSQDTETESVMTEKKGIDLILTTNQLSVTEKNKSITVPQKMSPAYLSTTE